MAAGLDIKEIACPFNRDDLFATATLEGSVHVWSFAERRLISTFQTVFDVGGRRLAVSDEVGPTVIAGAWRVHGICAYGGEGSGLIWQRKDLKQVEHLDPLPAGRIGAGFEPRSLHVLDVASGETVMKIRGAERLKPSRFAPCAVGPGKGGSGEFSLYDIEAGKRLWRRRLSESATVMDATVGPESLLVAEMDGPLRCFSFAGDELWWWVPPPGNHVIELARTASGWAGVLYPFEHAPAALLAFSDDGELESATDLARTWDYAFLPSGHFVVLATGEVRGVPDGQVVWKLSAS